MDSRILQPIPTPPSQRWREVRLVYLPRLLFAAGIALVAWLWTDSIAPSALVAEAEVIAGELRSPQAGVIASLQVSVNQSVRAGDVLGTVTVANPMVLGATLDVIRAEVGMLIASDSKRVALEYERLQLDWISQRVDRAAVLGRLQQVEAELARAEPLHKAGLLSEENISQLKLTRESLQAQALERSKLIERLEPSLRSGANSEAASIGQAGDAALAAAIKVQDAKIKLAETQLKPLPLLAPIDGVVSVLLRRTGETVVAGEPILLITAPKPGRLTAYLQQPLPFVPKAGMAVEIRTRTMKRRSAATTITHVGPALETISPTLLVAMRLPTVPMPETGIRVEFALPSSLELRPGEHVDVVLR